MKNAIVADGALRLLEGRRAKYLQETGAKPADELAKASFMGSLWRCHRIWKEFNQRRPGDHQPSPGTLW